MKRPYKLHRKNMNKIDQYFTLTAKTSSNSNNSEKPLSNNDINDLINKVGQEAVCNALTILDLELHCKEIQSHYLYMQQQIIEGFLEILASQDPHSIHYYIVRSVLLEIHKEAAEDNTTVDALARESIKHYQSMLIKIKSHKSYFNQIRNDIVNQSVNHEKPRFIFFNDNSAELESIDISCIENDLFLWDKVWLDEIASTGLHGEKLSNECKQPRRDRLQKYKAEKQLSIQFWVNVDASNNKPFYESVALKKLVQAIYEDKIRKLFQFKKKESPSITSNVHNNFMRLTDPSNNYEQLNNGRINLNNQKEIIAYSMPCITEELTRVVLRGAGKLNTVTSHRLVRYFIIQGYENYINNSPDPRSLYFERGCTDIADALKLSGKQSISDISDILHALAYMEFNLVDSRGNLLQLSKYRTRNNRMQGIQVVLGEPLMPRYVFSQSKKSLLIPILSDPPIVGPTQFHAKLFHLQMGVISTFSENSTTLYNTGAIYISDHQWSELCRKSEFKDTKYHKMIRDRWTQDGDDCPKLLDEIDKNIYTLGPAHEKALMSLKEQGRRRDRGHQQGIKSASCRKLRSR